MAAQRERDQAAGVTSVTVKAPSSAKPALHRVAKLLREGTETRAAFRMVGGSNEPEPTSDVWRVQAELLKDERDRLRGDLDQANRERSQLTGMLGGLQEQIGQTVARLEAQAANIATLEPISPLIKSNPSMRDTTYWAILYWAIFRPSDLYAICLKRSQEFINGLLRQRRASLHIRYVGHRRGDALTLSPQTVNR